MSISYRIAEIFARFQFWRASNFVKIGSAKNLLSFKKDGAKIKSVKIELAKKLNTQKFYPLKFPAILYSPLFKAKRRTSAYLSKELMTTVSEFLCSTCELYCFQIYEISELLYNASVRKCMDKKQKFEIFWKRNFLELPYTDNEGTCA